MSLTVHPPYDSYELLDVLLPEEELSIPVAPQGTNISYAGPIALNEVVLAVEALRDSGRGVAEHVYEEIIQRAQKETPSSLHIIDGSCPTFVQFPEQDFVLSPLPCPGEVGAYISLCLCKDVHVMVSVHEFSDAKRGGFGCSKFWDQSILSKLNLGGWTIQVQSSSVFARGTQVNSKREIPQIVETTMFATSTQGETRIMTHLHYEGWPDLHVAPDELLLRQLLDRVRELSPDPRKPIAINCLAGMWRTFNVAAAYFLRRKIEEARQRREDMALYQVDLCETLFEFRKQRYLPLPLLQRRYLIGLYTQILSVTSDYRVES
jgi:protein tyrosine phosphatase